MGRLRSTWPIWLGFVVSLLGLISYFLFFARFPVTRNVPWVNFLLFATSAALLLGGWRKVLTGQPPRGGKVVSSLLTIASLSIFGAFCFFIFYASRKLPAAIESPKIGQRAPEFALRDTHENPVSLATLLSTPLDPSSPSPSLPRGVLLVFYRGYW